MDLKEVKGTTGRVTEMVKMGMLMGCNSRVGDDEAYRLDEEVWKLEEEEEETDKEKKRKRMEWERANV